MMGPKIYFNNQEKPHKMFDEIYLSQKEKNNNLSEFKE